MQQLKDFNRHIASRGPSAVAELLVPQRNGSDARMTLEIGVSSLFVNCIVCCEIQCCKSDKIFFC